MAPEILIQKKWLIILIILFASLFVNSSGHAGEPSSLHITPKVIRKAVRKNTRQAITPTIPRQQVPNPGKAGPIVMPLPSAPHTRTIDTDTGQAFKPRFTIRSPHTGAITSIAFSPDGNMLAGGSKNGCIQLWNLKTGQRDKNLTNRSVPILCLAFVPGGRFLVSGAKDGTASLWDLKSGRKVRDFRGSSGPVFDVATSSNGQFLMTGTGDGVRVWDLKKGAIVRKIAGHRGSVSCTAISRNSKKAASGTRDGKVRIWNWQTGAKLMTLDGRGGKVCSVTLDGKYLAAGLENGMVRVWNVTDGQEIWSGTDHKGPVPSVSISPGREFAASAGSDSKICLWSLSAGEKVRCFTGHQGRVNDAAFTRDGRYLLTAGEDRTLRFWNPNSGKEIARLISMRSGWAVVSPEGYFDGTLDGDLDDRLDAVQWSVGKRSFAMGNFLEGYYKPALLGRLLAGKRVKKNEKLPDISEGFGLPPRIRIMTPGNNSRVYEPVIAVTVEAADQGGGINGIRMFHNGKVADDTDAQRRTGNNKKIRTKTYKIGLVNGKNIFRATGFSNDRIESEPDEITVVCRLAKGPQKPALHVVAVGINQYRNPRLNLNFGVPDAMGVLEYFTVSYTGMFDRLIKHGLFDHEATQSSVYNIMKSLQNIPPQDTVVIYFAGHGETLGDNWYFIPYDLSYPERDKHLRKKGVSSEMLQLYIARIGARRILLMLDACKSGAAVDVFAEYDDRRPFALLSRSTGIHMAAAATRKQNAGELEELGHGLFTYTLLEAFNGKADLKPSDGNVSVREILDYIRQQMPALIKKHRLPTQKPVINSMGMNFLIAALKSEADVLETAGPSDSVDGTVKARNVKDTPENTFYFRGRGGVFLPGK